MEENRTEASEGTEANMETPNVINWHPTPVLFLENPMDGGAW